MYTKVKTRETSCGSLPRALIQYDCEGSILSMDDNQLPATQPVLPSLLGDVVAYVEVRSGHDNRSRGVISELRSLGAKIATKLDKDVTHVVFHGGRVSTYRKARKMCNVVAVSWIEASKELGSKASEEEHPPPGFEKYEDPDSARKIKVLKSMQPDFDDQKDNERLKAILEKIKKRDGKRLASSADEMRSTVGEPGRKRKKTTSFKMENNQSKSTVRSVSLTSLSRGDETKSDRPKRRLMSSGLELTNSAENGVSSKRKSLVKKVKLFSHCGDVARASSSEIITVGNEDVDYGNTGQKRSNREKKNGTELAAQENSKSQKNTQKPIEFAFPKPVKNNRSSDKSPAGQRKIAVPSSKNHAFIHTKEKTKTEYKAPSEISVLHDINKSPPLSSLSHCVESRPLQTRPLVFIENIQREKDHNPKNNNRIDEPSQFVIPDRQTRRSSGLAGPLIQVKKNTGGEECQFDTNATNPFVAKVLEVLADRNKKPKVVLKSPWRRQGPAAVERRQSPRLRALQKENHSVSELDESDGPSSSAESVQSKTSEPRKKIGPASASAHMFKLWKTKPRKINSPDTALLDISYGPAMISQRSKQKRCDTGSGSSVCSLPGVFVRENLVEHSPVREDLRSRFPLELPNCEPTEGDRSASPILGTRVKYRKTASVLSNSCLSTKAPSGITTLMVTSSERIPTETQGLNWAVVATAAHKSEACEWSEVKKKTEQDVLPNECAFSSSARNGFGTEGSRTDSLDTSAHSFRKRSRSGRVQNLPTLVCTYLKASDVKRVRKAARDLGKFEFEEQVSERTTHLVASGPRRTINMLRAICRGCWILKDEWVYESVKAQKWLPEENYELTEFSPMVQQRRLLRHSSCGLNQWNLLSSVGPIYVNKDSEPQPSELRDLIHLSGGSIAKSVKKAAVTMGPRTKFSPKRKNGKPHVEPVWLLDCIVKGERLPFS